MNTDTYFKEIKKLYQILFGKDAEVSLTYKGTEFGVTQPWHVRVDNRESKHETHDGALNLLLTKTRVS